MLLLFTWKGGTHLEIVPTFVLYFLLRGKFNNVLLIFPIVVILTHELYDDDDDDSLDIIQ